MNSSLSNLRIRRLTLMMLLVGLSACTGTAIDGSATGGDLGVVPGDPGWLPVVPPHESVCVGVKPGPEAWALSRAIAEAAAARQRNESDAVGEQSDAGFVDDDVFEVNPDFSLPPLPDTPEDEAEADPCSPTYEVAADCLGADPPAFAAYDFQPQSCGFGATYGLDVLKGRVTFVALFASW